MTERYGELPRTFDFIDSIDAYFSRNNTLPHTQLMRVWVMKLCQQYIPNLLVPAAPTDIFSLAVTPTCIFSASGSSTINIYSTTTSDFPLIQSLKGAHKLGCHHVATSRDGKKAVSVGFGGEAKIWNSDGDEEKPTWSAEGAISG